MGVTVSFPLQRPASNRRRGTSVSTVEDWNVVVSVREGGYKQGRALLRELGFVHGTPYYNVLALWVADIREAMESLRGQCDINPRIKDWLGHFVPVTSTFTFNSPEEFDAKLEETLGPYLPRLAGKSFYVRMHRRGFKGRLDEGQEERRVGELVLDALEKAGTPARVTFDDPDLVLVIETIGQQAGLSLWTREDRVRYPFLHLTS